MNRVQCTPEPYAVLENILKEELGVYQELIELSRQEQRLLVQGRADDLPPVTAAKEKALAQIEMLEQQRRTEVRRLPIVYDGDRESLTLRALAELLPDLWRRRFRELQRQLAASLEELHFLNEYNASLLRHSLEYTSYLLAFLTGNAHAPVYTGSGQIAAGQHPPRVLNRKV